MSRLITPTQPRIVLDATAQVKYFAEAYRASINPDTLGKLKARAAELALHFTDDELFVIAALDTPDKVQNFIDTQLYYNDDHASVEQEETAMPPRRVLQTGMAHCFEGALFAYAVNFLHGHNPQLMLIETIQDIEHNLVVWRDARTGRYGCNAQSTYPGLDGRPARFKSLYALAESYYPYYYSVRSGDYNDILMVGYSEPFDLTARFGTAWMASETMLWDIYYTYINDSVLFHYLENDAGTPHLYPLIHALKEKWIRVADGKGWASIHDLPPAAQTLWHEFWRLHSDATKRPRGRAQEIEMEFFRLTGTTPIDLLDNADDLQWFLAAGYKIEQIFQPPISHLQSLS